MPSSSSWRRAVWQDETDIRQAATGERGATFDDRQPTTDCRVSAVIQLSVAECRMSLKLES